MMVCLARAGWIFEISEGMVRLDSKPVLLIPCLSVRCQSILLFNLVVKT